MKDAYYYFYYLAVVFIKKVERKPRYWNRGESYYYNTGGIIVTFFVSCNLLTVLFLVASKIQPYFGYCIGIPVCIINYYLFSKANKGRRIFEAYDQKFKASPTKNRIKAMVVLYVCVTILLTTFLIVSYRLNHNIKGN
jgi:hypothetical protein